MKRTFMFWVVAALAGLGPLLGCETSSINVTGAGGDAGAGAGGGAGAGPRTSDAGSPPVDAGGGTGAPDAGPRVVDAGVRCGNGVVDVSQGETCDTALQPGSGGCPASCGASDNACNPVVLKNPGTCEAVCTPEAITACAGDDGCCPAACDATNDSDCVERLDTTGTWYTYTSAPGKVKTSGLGITFDVTITTWTRTYESPTGDITFNICGLKVVGSKFSTVYTPAVIATMQASARAVGDLVVPVGSSLTDPTYLIYSGRDESGNSVDKVPPPFPGGDGDGKKGVTVPTKAKVLLDFASFDTYTGMLITTTTTDLKAASPTTKQGMTSVTTHGVVFDSTDAFYAPADSTYDVTFNAGSIPFTSTKLASDDSATYSCDYIVNHYP